MAEPKETKKVAPELSLEEQLANANKRIASLEQEIKKAYGMAQAYANSQANLINGIKGTIDIARDNMSLITSANQQNQQR